MFQALYSLSHLRSLLLLLWGVDKKLWTEKQANKQGKLSSHCLMILKFHGFDFTIEIEFPVPEAFSLPSLTLLLLKPALQPKCSSMFMRPWSSHLALNVLCVSLLILCTYRLSTSSMIHSQTFSPFNSFESSDVLLFSINLCEKPSSNLDTFSCFFHYFGSTYHSVSWLN